MSSGLLVYRVTVGRGGFLGDFEFVRRRYDEYGAPYSLKAALAHEMCLGSARSHRVQVTQSARGLSVLDAGITSETQKSRLLRSSLYFSLGLVCL